MEQKKEDEASNFPPTWNRKEDVIEVGPTFPILHNVYILYRYCVGLRASMSFLKNRTAASQCRKKCQDFGLALPRPRGRTSAFTANERRRLKSWQKERTCTHTHTHTRNQDFLLRRHGKGETFLKHFCYLARYSSCDERFPYKQDRNRVRETRRIGRKKNNCRRLYKKSTMLANLDRGKHEMTTRIIRWKRRDNFEVPTSKIYI